MERPIARYPMAHCRACGEGASLYEGRFQLDLFPKILLLQCLPGRVVADGVEVWILAKAAQRINGGNREHVIDTFGCGCRFVQKRMYSGHPHNDVRIGLCVTAVPCRQVHRCLRIANCFFFPSEADQGNGCIQVRQFIIGFFINLSFQAREKCFQLTRCGIIVVCQSMRYSDQDFPLHLFQDDSFIQLPKDVERSGELSIIDFHSPA